MIIVASKPTTARARATTPVRDTLPFGRLDPIAGTHRLPPSASQGLPALQAAAGSAVPALVRQLVAFSIEATRPQGHPTPPSVSILNRRRRAATLWIQALLAGAVDDQTCHQVTHAFVPQLAGTGPELRRSASFGRPCVEFLRGLVTARIFDQPAANLVPQAKALYALETTLAIHLAAIETAAES